MSELNDISEKEVLSLLPTKFVESFSPMLSLESMLLLIDKHGGENIFISTPDLAKDGALSGMSDKDIQAICTAASGCYFAVPKGMKFHTYMRNKEIVRLANSGTEFNTLSRRFHITQRQLRRIVKKSRAEQSRGTQ